MRLVETASVPTTNGHDTRPTDLRLLERIANDAHSTGGENRRSSRTRLCLVAMFYQTNTLVIETGMDHKASTSF